jgi:hypothetical protein
LEAPYRDKTQKERCRGAKDYISRFAKTTKTYNSRDPLVVIHLTTNKITITYRGEALPIFYLACGEDEEEEVWVVVFAALPIQK